MAASTERNVKVRVTGQGEADVIVDGKKLGWVSHSASARGWFAYNNEGARVDDSADHVREAAVRTLVKSYFPHET